jgi:hypothetical protein
MASALPIAITLECPSGAQQDIASTAPDGSQELLAGLRRR